LTFAEDPPSKVCLFQVNFAGLVTVRHWVLPLAVSPQGLAVDFGLSFALHFFLLLLPAAKFLDSGFPNNYSFSVSFFGETPCATFAFTMIADPLHLRGHHRVPFSHPFPSVGAGILSI